jgi:tetratricopeptide (TPR) repeat protein
MRNSTIDRIFRSAILLVAALAGALPGAAEAQSLARQWAWCREDDVERQIIGCSVVIRSGRDTPERLSFAFANRGRAWSDKGRYDRAIQDLDNAVRLDSNNADAFNYRGVAWIAQGQYDHAIQDFDVAIRLDPNYAIAIYNRGLALQTLGRTEAAARDFATAKQVGPRLTPPKE